MYRSSSVSNSFDNGRGAGKDSESFDVYELATAKYNIVNWPEGAFRDFDMGGPAKDRSQRLPMAEDIGCAEKTIGLVRDLFFNPQQNTACAENFG